ELQRLLARHERLMDIHRAIVVHDVEPSLLMMFADTRVNPRRGPGRASLGGPEPAGPLQPLPRLLWLATEEAEAWTPTAAQLRQQYADWERSLYAPQPAEPKV